MSPYSALLWIGVFVVCGDGLCLFLFFVVVTDPTLFGGILSRWPDAEIGSRLLLCTGNAEV